MFTPDCCTNAEYSQGAFHDWDCPARQADVFDPCLVLRPDRVIIADTARVDSFTKIEGGEGVTIGEYVHVASFAHLNVGGGRLTLEDGSAVASGARIVTGGNQPDGVSMSAVAPEEQQVIRRSSVTIGKNACLGTGAIVLGANMGEGAILAAGAVATKDIPPFEIWAGVPARRIGTRQRRD